MPQSTSRSIHKSFLRATNHKDESLADDEGTDAIRTMPVFLRIDLYLWRCILRYWWTGEGAVLHKRYALSATASTRWFMGTGLLKVIFDAIAQCRQKLLQSDVSSWRQTSWWRPWLDVNPAIAMPTWSSIRNVFCWYKAFWPLGMNMRAPSPSILLLMESPTRS
jgi:hypothetical protein